MGPARSLSCEPRAMPGGPAPSKLLIGKQNFSRLTLQGSVTEIRLGSHWHRYCRGMGKCDRAPVFPRRRFSRASRIEAVGTIPPPGGLSEEPVATTRRASPHGLGQNTMFTLPISDDTTTRRAPVVTWLILVACITV